MTAARVDVMSASNMARGVTLANVRSRVSEAEWQARVELAALYRLVAHFRWTETIYNHISLRVPGEHHFLLNPFGYLYEEITASSLAKVDIHGEILSDPTGLGINKAGFVIHSAIHAGRPDIACVMHTHTRAGSAVSAQDAGILPISQHAASLIRRVGYHDFEGVAFNLAERERLVRDLGPHYALILRNHGLVATGRNAGEALWLMTLMERTCEIQLAALSGGVILRHITQESIDACNAAIESANGDFSRDWAAMLRLADRVAPDFRT